MASLSSYYPQPVIAGTTAGTYAEGDDSRIVGAASKAWPAGVTKTVYLSARTDGVAGSGTLADPYDVSTPNKWESTFKSLPNGCIVRLLAGEYSIRGTNFNDQNDPIYPDGISIIGEGINQTIITVTELPSNPSGGYIAFLIGGYNQGDYGNPYVTTLRQKNCVISDLTIDCNWQNLRMPSAVSGAIFLDGSENCAVKRCRVINFGGDNGESNGAFLREAFPVLVAGDNSIVEDCVVESPIVGINSNDSEQVSVYATFISVGTSIDLWQQTVRSVSSDSSNNTITHQQRYENGDIFIFSTLSGGSPFVVGKQYYVINAANNGNTFQLSETANGSAIDFEAISSGSGGGIRRITKCIVKNNIIKGPSRSFREGFGVILGSGYGQIIIEGNKFENLTFGCYGDSFHSGMAIIKNNIFENCRRQISVETGINGPLPQLQELVVSDNAFLGYGINGSGSQPSGTNTNLIGGWCLRANNVRKVSFERNRIESMDGLPILEALPFIGQSEVAVIKNNLFHSLCGNSGTTVSMSWIDEGNHDEFGIPRYSYSWHRSSIEVDGSYGGDFSFTASASTNVVTIANCSTGSFYEGMFVYLYNLAGGNGLSADTRYYVRDVSVSSDLSRLISCKLYTTKTGGSPVDITGDYTSASRISNRAFRNGKALESALGVAFSARPSNKDRSNDNRFAIFLKEGLYETELIPSVAPPTRMPAFFNLIGIGSNKNIILRAWNAQTIYGGFGDADNWLVRNITAVGWGPEGIAVSPSANALTDTIVEDVIFSVGAGGKAVGGGASGLQNLKLVRCSSNEPMFDTVLNQGIFTGESIDCSWTNGFCINCSGATFRKSNVKINLNLTIGSGIIDSCVFENNGTGTSVRIVADGARITDSKIRNLWIEPSNNNETYIANTIIEPLAGTTYAIEKFGNPAIVKLSNVAMSKLIDSNITVTSLNLFNQTAFLSGTGAPSASAPNGSIYLRTDGDPSSTVYVRAGNQWRPLGAYEP
jgi:hypothetical protein